jgi:hypothetical protein
MANMPATERDVLDAIQEVIREADVHGSHERGKNFYTPMNLPTRLDEYLKAAKLSIPQAAKAFRMSPQSLRSILKNGSVSENMLFRLQNAMEYAAQHPGISIQKDDDTFPGDWRGTKKESVQQAIAVVTQKLIYLRDAVLGSNSLSQDGAPIDPLQVAQLIALLEAMLAALKAPLIDAQNTSGFFKWLAKLGKRGVEKGLEGKVSDAFDQAIDAGGQLFDAMANSSGPSDLGGIVF